MGFNTRAPPYDANEWVTVTPLIFEGDLFAGSTYGVLLKWDKINNLWSIAAPSPTGWVYNIPALLMVFDGDLYCTTTSGYDLSGLYKWNGSDAWIHICDFPTVLSAGIMVVFNGNLYATSVGSLYLFTGTALTKVVDTLYPGTNKMLVESMINFNGKLYAGASIGPAPHSSVLLEWDGSSSTWTVVATSADWHIMSMAIYNGKLFCGTYHDVSHLYEWNGVDGFITRATRTNYDGLTCLIIHRGQLYSGTNNGNLLRWDDAASLILMAHGGPNITYSIEFTF